MQRVSKARQDSCLKVYESLKLTDFTDDEDRSTPDTIIDKIGIKELLEQDSRPTFIIDLLDAEKEIEGRMNVVWCNKVCTPDLCMSKV